MTFSRQLKENIFLVIFFIVSLWYGFSNITGDVGSQYFLKPFMVSSILIHYLIKAKKINNFFITALFFALLGDLFFNIVTEQGFIYGLASFLVFNLFMMIIVTEKAGEIRISNLFLSMIPFLLLLFIMVYYIFPDSGELKILLTIYSTTLVFLCTFSLYYYIKTKSVVSQYFLLGCSFFVLAGIAKLVKDYIGVTISMEIMNNVCYMLSLYFYYKALIAKEVRIDTLSSENQEPHVYYNEE